MRIRTIKPEWLDDERLALATSDARVLSVALMLLADDYGRGRANPIVLGARVFPGKILGTVEKALETLRGIRFVHLYTVDGQDYFEIRNWAKHQKVDKPGKPQVPEYTGQSYRPENPPEVPEKIIESLATDQDQDQDQDQDLDTSASPPSVSGKIESVKRVFSEWLREHVDPAQWAKSKLNDKRRRVIEARLREGYEAERLIDAIRGVKRSRWHMGENPEGKRYAGLETILRDGAQVEKFEALLGEPQGQRSSSTGMRPCSPDSEFLPDGDSDDVIDNLFAPTRRAHA